VKTSSSGDEIANVNCFTTTSDTYYKLTNRLAHGTHIGHTVFTINRKQQETITSFHNEQRKREGSIFSAKLI